ncbi:MAG: glycoside hydrolase domain-containing protein [Planctomycetota bacterium]
MNMIFWTKVKVAAVVAGVAMISVGVSVAARQPVVAEDTWAGTSQAGEGPEAGKVILDTRSFWRWRTIWETEEIQMESGEVGHFYLKRDEKTKVVTPQKVNSYRLPPTTSADWMKPDFDDSAWLRFRGPLGGFDIGMKNLCLRGRFQVTDPAKAGEMDLTLSFLGGVVVYLNGDELGRAFMPQGEVKLDTVAEPYPKEAYTDPNGFLLGQGASREDRANARKLRVREARFNLPAAKLRKGTNILAVAIHRPPACHLLYSHRIKAWDMSAYDGRSEAPWGRVAFESLKLIARPDAPVEPNVACPKELRVWNQNSACNVYTGDYGDPGEKLQRVRITGTRNGAFSRGVVAGSDKPIKGLRAEPSDLRGPGTIPAAAVQVRYALPDGENRRWAGALGSGTPFDSLEETPPAEVPVRPGGGAVQPIWFTVKVPKEATPGDYHGKLTVSAEGAGAVEVPLALTIVNWAMPDPQDFVTEFDAIESPESVAMRYEVPLWSDRHWQLLDKAFRLLGQVGGKTLYVTCVRRTHFGNEHAMIRWTKGADGRLAPDFSIAEKYLDTARKHLNPRAVVLYCWEPPESLGHAGFGPGRTHDRDILLTVADPATGGLREEQGPKWGTPECKELWKSLVEGWRKILEKRGLGNAMMFGLVGDHRPTRQAMDDVCTAAPDGRWAMHSHHYADEWEGHPVGFCATVWGIKAQVVDPELGYGYGWRRCLVPGLEGFWQASYPRGVHNGSPLTEYRTYTERYLGAVPYPHMGTYPKVPGVRGIGRVGVDFWRVAERGGKWNGYIAGRYPETAWGQLNITYATAYILGPGRDGPVATMRSEAYRENFQEIEARVFIERCFINDAKEDFEKKGKYGYVLSTKVDEARKARLGEDLYRRCRDALDERIRATIRVSEPEGWAWYLGSGWEEREGKLYTLAAEVAGKIGGK